MALRDLIPWNRSRNVTVRRTEDSVDPFLTLHREMNRLFDDVFRSFDMAPFGDRWRERPWHDRSPGWPHLDAAETDNEFRVSVELPGVDERDVSVELSSGVLVIKGERNAVKKDATRWFSERFYGRFERRIGLTDINDIDADKATASFRNGVLSVVLPKSAEARRKVKRIAINGNKNLRRIEYKRTA